jgi:hypothetical protein
MFLKSFFDLNRSNPPERSFRVRLARTPRDIKRAISIRPEKYAKHDPSFLLELVGAEADDVSADSIVIIAEDVERGDVLGTFRMEGNFNSAIYEEHIPEIKQHVPRGRLVSVSRLVVSSIDTRSEIKFALFKAAVKLCQAFQVNWLIVSALPPMDRQFGSVLAFEHLLPAGHYFERPDVPGAKFLLMGLEIAKSNENMLRHDPGLFRYFFEEFTPEIEIFGSLSSSFSKIRKSDRTRNSVGPDFLDESQLPPI